MAPRLKIVGRVPTDLWLSSHVTHLSGQLRIERQSANLLERMQPKCFSQITHCDLEIEHTTVSGLA
eukprot:4138506-Amphidinium_carterae.1